MLKESVPLTKKEEEILQLVKMGLSNKEIAARLGNAEGTIKHHVKIILAKYNVHDRKKLIAGNI